MKTPESYAEFLALSDAEKEELVKSMSALSEPKPLPCDKPPSVPLQPVVGSEIGSMDWGACMDCKHDIRGGGCAIAPDIFKAKIMFNLDSVYCGCFESRYADRPNPTGERTAHMVKEN